MAAVEPGTRMVAIKCIVCGAEMEQGGIVTSGITVLWVPRREFQKKGLRKLMYKDGKSIGHGTITDMVIGQTRIPNAYYCENCNKVIGIFDVKK